MMTYSVESLCNQTHWVKLSFKKKGNVGCCVTVTYSFPLKANPQTLLELIIASDTHINDRNSLGSHRSPPGSGPAGRKHGHLGRCCCHKRYPSNTAEQPSPS